MNNEREEKMGKSELALKIANELRQEDPDNADVVLEEAIVVVAQDVVDDARCVSQEHEANIKAWVAHQFGGANFGACGALEVLIDARRELGWMRRSTLVDGLADLCASMPAENIDGYLASVVREIKSKAAAQLSAVETSTSKT